MSAPKLVVLQSSDNATFEVDETVARKSETIKHMIDDGYTNTTIPLPNVTGPILANVIEYCRRHAEANDEDDEDVKNFDADFVRRVDHGTLFEIILAANYLDIKGLMDLTCQTVADMIKDMRVEEVRNIFNVENDFTPQEEEELRRENAWAFE